VVIARQVETDASALAADAQHESGAAVADRPRVFRSDSSLLAVGDFLSLELRADLPRPRIVEVHDRDAAAAEPAIDGALLARDPGNALEAAEMRRSDGSDDSDVGRGDPRQTRDLAGIARAELDDRGAVALGKPQQRKRQTDEIIVVALGLQHASARF